MSKQVNMTLFSTPRLLVRHYTINDADDFFLLNGNEEVMRYIRPVTSRAETDLFLKQNIDFYTQHPNLGRFAVYEIATGNFAGSFSLLLVDDHSQDVHIGYAFLPEVWGKGYATEITKGGIHFFFQQDMGDTLFGIVEKFNTVSEKVLLKCGFHFHSSYMEEDIEVMKYFIKRTG